MASIHSHLSHTVKRELRPAAALRRAWYWYLTLAFIPFFVAMAVIIDVGENTAPSHLVAARGWFIAAIAFMLVVGPLAFWTRSRLFKSYWHGQGVSPRHYLTGMIVVWMSFELGGLISLVGCLVSNSLLPCLMSALAAFVFFTTLYPNGRAMAQPTGNTDDPEIYQEPR